MKLLWYGETPYIETGAGQVARHLLPVFLGFFDQVHLVAINQWWDVPELPESFSISLCTVEDTWNVEAAKAAITSCNYDVLFVTTDLNRITDLREQLEHAHAQHKIIIMYAAMDCHIFQPEFFSVMELASAPVVFSYWCKRLVSFLLPELAKRTEVIYHGCEPDVFFPLDAQERNQVRKDFFNIGPETFLVVNVNRNQVRKDLARTMAAFHLFHLEHPDSLLYIHAKQRDLGGDLPQQAQGMGLQIYGKQTEIVFAPPEYHESGGISRADLNRVYNAADACVSTSTGEGWGLTTTEALAASRPFIGPENTVFPELLGDGGRGYLVRSGGPELWAMFYGVSDSPRELCSTTGMKRALERVYLQPGEAAAKAHTGREWAEQHSWSRVQEQWRMLLRGLLY
jgi:glycosyltransferase involved in cell wall biosynthesis